MMAEFLLTQPRSHPCWHLQDFVVFLWAFADPKRSSTCSFFLFCFTHCWEMKAEEEEFDHALLLQKQKLRGMGSDT